ncbi:hypothetical protein BR93DRAFT_721466 [Coniochaeta sp. PMI_546]|nr:hypothetical protein BR93DRAFT_721466 [Coniochaeta sp. PMI_546]
MQRSSYTSSYTCSVAKNYLPNLLNTQARSRCSHDTTQFLPCPAFPGEYCSPTTVCDLQQEVEFDAISRSLTYLTEMAVHLDAGSKLAQPPAWQPRCAHTLYPEPKYTSIQVLQFEVWGLFGLGFHMLKKIGKVWSSVLQLKGGVTRDPNFHCYQPRKTARIPSPSTCTRSECKGNTRLKYAIRTIKGVDMHHTSGIHFLSLALQKIAR